MEKRLSDVEPGQTCIVVRIGGDDMTRRRITAMGVVKCAKIKVVRRAPLGDPLEFELKGYNLSLRKEEAENIYVSLEE